VLQRRLVAVCKSANHRAFAAAKCQSLVRFAAGYSKISVIFTSPISVAMPQPLLRRLEKRLAAWRWQRAAVLAGISLGLALLLVVYLFGGDRLLGRLFSTFFVFFWLLALASYAIIPFVTWASSNWFGQRWRGGATVAAAPRRPAPAAPRPSNSPAAPRRPEPKR
jgi:hypothetical protein